MKRIGGEKKKMCRSIEAYRIEALRVLVKGSKNIKRLGSGDNLGEVL